MNRLAVPVLILIALAALATWGARKQTQPTGIEVIACTNPVSGCTFLHHEAPAQIRFSTQPKPLKPFVVTLSNPSITKASIAFRMAGMDMGFNRYDFVQGADAIWRAQITLPICVSGQTNWISELQLDDRLYSLSFITQH